MQQVKMAECYFHGDWEENIPEQFSPQPDQRRPDYVLGKIVENPKGTALRGMDEYRSEFKHG